jgi:hypothetical protein
MAWVLAIAAALVLGVSIATPASAASPVWGPWVTCYPVPAQATSPHQIRIQVEHTGSQFKVWAVEGRATNTVGDYTIRTDRVSLYGQGTTNYNPADGSTVHTDLSSPYLSSAWTRVGLSGNSWNGCGVLTDGVSGTSTTF